MCVGPQEGCTILQLASFRDISCRACLYFCAHIDACAHMDTLYMLALQCRPGQGTSEMMQLHSMLPYS